MNGCFLGIVSAHPIINNLCGFLEGTRKDDIADENHTQDKSQGQGLEQFLYEVFPKQMEGI